MQKHAIQVPATSNVEKIVLDRWYFRDKAHVEIGAVLCEIASKAPPDLQFEGLGEFAASLDIVTEWKGTLEIVAAEGSVVRPHQILGYITTID